MSKKEAADGLWRRQFLGGAGALALGGLTGTKLLAQPPANRSVKRRGSGFGEWKDPYDGPGQSGRLASTDPERPLRRRG